MDNASKKMWRSQFTPILHPHLPLIATLMDTADKLNSARGFIETLSPDVDAERKYGLFVATLAIRYAMKTLDFFGLVDGDDAPMPVNLTQAKHALTNLIAHINENIQHAQFAAGGRGYDEDIDSTEEEGIGDAPRRDATAIVPVDATPFVDAPSDDENTPVIDGATFTALCGDKICVLGNTKEFQLLERLHQGRKTFLSIAKLTEDVRWTPLSRPENGFN